MIDVEADVFNYVYPHVEPLVPYGCFKSMYVPTPPAFPFATLMEIDNRTLTRQRGTAVQEEYATVTFEANVYAEDKFSCRNVMDALDTAMVELGFIRNSMQLIPNLADSEIFRMVARYVADADAQKRIYRHY